MTIVSGLGTHHGTVQDSGVSGLRIPSLESRRVMRMALNGAVWEFPTWAEADQGRLSGGDNNWAESGEKSWFSEARASLIRLQKGVMGGALSNWFDTVPSRTCPQCRIQVGRRTTINKPFFDLAQEEGVLNA